MMEISGGRVNKISSLEHSISKTYSDGGIVKGLGVSAHQRWKNEITALSSYKEKTFEPLRVPNIISTNEQTLTTIIERINANPIEDIINQNVFFFTDDRAVKLALILKRIHSSKKIINSNVYRQYMDTFNLYAQKTLPLLSKERIDGNKITKWMGKSLSKLNSSQEIVSIHSDFWLENILVDAEYNFYVIDWEFFSMGSLYEDLGVFYANVHEHFPELQDFCRVFFNAYDPYIDFELIRAFGVYRCIRLLSYVDMDDYEKEPIERPHSFKELINIVRKNVYN